MLRKIEAVERQDIGPEERELDERLETMERRLPLGIGLGVYIESLLQISETAATNDPVRQLIMAAVLCIDMALRKESESYEWRGRGSSAAPRSSGGQKKMNAGFQPQAPQSGVGMDRTDVGESPREPSQRPSISARSGS